MPILIFLIALLAGVSGLAPAPVQEQTFGAPSTQLTYEKTLIPIADSLYDLGTSTSAWRNAYIDRICLNGDCQTAWPSGSGNAFDYPFPSNATSTQITFNGGIVGALTGNADTATALAANPTNCSAGNYPLGIDASGNVENCTSASGTADAFEIATTSGIAISQVPYYTKTGGRTTISGVATSSLTATSPLSLSQPISVIGSLASALSISTAGTWSGNAGTATALAANGANCGTAQFPNGVDASGAAENCTATSTWFGTGNTNQVLGWNGSATAWLATSTLFANASAVNSGLLTSTDWSTFNSKVSGTRALTVAGTANQITSSAGSQDLSADRTWTLSIPSLFRIQQASTTDFSANTLAVGGTATTSISAAGNLTAGGTLVVTGQTTLATSLSGVLKAASGVVSAGVDGTDYTLTNAITCSAGDFISAVTAAGVSTCSTPASGSAGNWFTADNTYNTAVNATSTKVWFKAGLMASTTSFLNTIVTDLVHINGLGNGIAFSAAGEFQIYGGTTCTNQFVRALNTLGDATCATVGAADVSLANLTATDSSLTFSGTYNGSTARTIGLNVGNANTWTALQKFFGSASSTLMSSTQAWFGATATTTITSGGYVGIASSTPWGKLSINPVAGDGTAPSFVIGSSTATMFKIDNAGQVVVTNNKTGRTGLLSPSIYSTFTYATTSFVGTTTIPLGVAIVPETWKSAVCYTNAGTANVQFYNGTAKMNMIAASTATTTNTLSTNNAYTTTGGATKRSVDIGTPASSPTSISCTIEKVLDAQ